MNPRSVARDRRQSAEQAVAALGRIYEGAAWRFLTTWVRALRWQQLPAFDKVAQLLSRHLDGILAYCHVKAPFGKVEAINGNIRAMIRRGRGYRDHEYLLSQSSKGHRRASPAPAHRMNIKPITDPVRERKILRRYRLYLPERGRGTVAAVGWRAARR